MRAAQFTAYGPPSVLTVGETEDPHAAAGQIRIRVRAAGITPSDATIRSGAMSDFLPLPLPHIPGFDAAGEVDEIGDGVTGVELGDAVFGLTPMSSLGGSNAELAVLDVWAAKPDALSWEQAGGAAANIETSVRVLQHLDVGPGKVLLIEGAAGGVGTTAIQLAVSRGATVIGTASEPNHELLRSLGALPTTYGPGLAERVAELAPDGVDGVIDAAGSGSLVDLIAIAGKPSNVVSIVDQSAPAHGAIMSHTGPGGDESSGAVGLVEAAGLAERGVFTVPVHATYSLADVALAHEASETRRARGKIVITVP